LLHTASFSFETPGCLHSKTWSHEVPLSVAYQLLNIDLLYHVNRAIIDFAQDKSSATQTTDVFGTFTDLAATNAAARSALPSEGYLIDDFVEYEENDGTKEWKHADGVIVFAKAPAGQEFVVRLDTTSNALHFKGNASSEVEGHLHYSKHSTFLPHDSKN
jgi:outer membrane protein assembly factor BamB